MLDAGGRRVRVHRARSRSQRRYSHRCIRRACAGALRQNQAVDVGGSTPYTCLLAPTGGACTPFLPVASFPPMKKSHHPKNRQSLAQKPIPGAYPSSLALESFPRSLAPETDPTVPPWESAISQKKMPRTWNLSHPHPGKMHFFRESRPKPVSCLATPSLGKLPFLRRVRPQPGISTSQTLYQCYHNQIGY